MSITIDLRNRHSYSRTALEVGVWYGAFANGAQVCPYSSIPYRHSIGRRVPTFTVYPGLRVSLDENTTYTSPVGTYEYTTATSTTMYMHFACMIIIYLWIHFYYHVGVPHPIRPVCAWMCALVCALWWVQSVCATKNGCGAFSAEPRGNHTHTLTLTSLIRSLHPCFI